MLSSIQKDCPLQNLLLGAWVVWDLAIASSFYLASFTTKGQLASVQNRFSKRSAKLPSYEGAMYSALQQPFTLDSQHLQDTFKLIS